MGSIPPISLGKVLIVGGCGFLGSHFVEQLLGFPTEEAESTTKGANGTAMKDSVLLKPKTNTANLPHSSTIKVPSLASRFPKYVNTELHVFDLRCNKNVFDGVTYHEGDMTSPEAVLEVFKKVQPDVIFHTASPFWDSPKAILHKVNVGGTKVLLEVAGGQHGDWGGSCKAFVYTSSSSVIHDTKTDLINANEKYPYVRPNVLEYYSETKGEAEELVLESNNKYNGLLTCALRPAGIMGERDVQFSSAILQHAAAAPSWQLRMQLGVNDNLFDTTYVGNLVYAHCLAAQRLLQTHKRVSEGGVRPLNTENVDGEAFIITNDSPVTFWDATHFLWSLLGKVVEPQQIVAIPEGFAWPLGAISQAVTSMLGRKSRFNPQTVRYSCMIRYFSCDKAKLRLGYRPPIGLEEGLTRSAKSFLEQLEAMVSEGEKKKKQ